jgi:hypothetical protein
VNGAVGAVVVPHGRPLSVMTFTVARGQIAGIEIIADPPAFAGSTWPSWTTDLRHRSGPQLLGLPD